MNTIVAMRCSVRTFVARLSFCCEVVCAEKCVYRVPDRGVFLRSRGGGGCVGVCVCNEMLEYTIIVLIQK